MAATRSSGRGRIAERSGPAAGASVAVPHGEHWPQGPAEAQPLEARRAVEGPVRPGRKTKLLVKHLVRGDIALVDHLDIDRVSAEELIAAGAVAVLNCSRSSSGTYPNLGPQLLVEAGILLVDLPNDSLFDGVSDGDPLIVRVGGDAGSGRKGAAVLRKRKLLASGEVLDLERISAETELRRREIGEALERFAHNTIEHMREERELLSGASSCRASPPTSATAPRSWSCGALATSATCAPCGPSSATCARCWWRWTAAPRPCWRPG